MKCYRDGGCGPYEMYSCTECPASKPEYAEKNAPKTTGITNEIVIRNLWTKKQLAEALISCREEDDWDYDWDDEPYVCGSYDIYTTSDGEDFSDYESAFEHEMWWLSQEVRSE